MGESSSLEVGSVICPCKNNGSAMFCLSPVSGFVVEQWVGEESKSPKVGAAVWLCTNGGSIGEDWAKRWANAGFYRLGWG